MKSNSAEVVAAGAGKVRLLDCQQVLPAKFTVKQSTEQSHSLWVEIGTEKMSQESVTDFTFALGERNNPYLYLEEAQTDDGNTLKSSKLIYLDARITADHTDGTARFTFKAIPSNEYPFLEIGGVVNPVRHRFYVANLLYGAWPDRRDDLTWNTLVNSRCVNIKLSKVEQYKDAVQKIRRGPSGEITCTLTVATPDGSTLAPKAAVDLADQVLWLISFAAGHRVYWVNREHHDADGKRLLHLRAGSIRAPGGLWGCINLDSYVRGHNNRAIAYLQIFVARTLDRFRELYTSQRDCLTRIIHAYCAGLQTSYDLPVASYAIGYALEALVNCFLAPSKGTYFKVDPLLDPRKWYKNDELYDEIKDFLKNKVIPKLTDRDEDLGREFGKELYGIIMNIMRRPIKIRTAKLMNQYGVSYEQQVVDLFWQKLRNPSIHGDEPADWAEAEMLWTKAVALIEKCMLQILDYKGPYIDRTVHEQNMIEFRP